MEKNLEFSEDQIEKASHLLKCISNPIRIKILLYVAKNKEASVNEICKHAESEQSLTSHHLLVMKNANVLVSKIVGKQRMYSLKNDNILTLLQLVHSNI